MLDRMVFRGRVCNGNDLFAKEMVVPGAAKISQLIRDWPERLQKGTLNVGLDGFPESFLVKIGNSVRALDRRGFRPEAELASGEIENNTLPPIQTMPDRGNAQIWRATLVSDRSGAERLCWVLRRIGSGLSMHVELVAGEHLRDALVLATGDSVKVMVEGRWTW